MNIKWIIIIAFGSLLLITILILAILAFFQQQRIKQYQKIKTNYQKEINLVKTNFNNNFKPISIKYELPYNEICYLHQKIKGTILSQKQIKKNFFLFELKDYQQFSLTNLNGFLNFRSHKENPDYYGDIYLTNQRVLIDEVNKAITIWLTDIITVLPTILNINNTFQPGLLLIAKQKLVYCFWTDDVKMGLRINELLQQKRGQKGD
ncbi:hypothetical protein [Spiroplasma chrysopicola]|uniref:Transmembrane protein n=1 Tax=Spiroplasma chrysopicola DF-1 TaxID=1276227 RepID=R4U3G3_9MOLU|nr:hypothetical protein [Spiroplasma chrysopicola]AGM25038.1 hypothetical protein SCHRY_v1c04570 [Spiroplasma chrysopicola DF-1]